MKTLALLLALPALASAAPLPGKGLAQHDFFYAGEAMEETMHIVRGGKITWTYTHNGKGEISDAVLQPNGNILFAHQFGIAEINAAKKVLWHHDAPPGTEIHTAQPFGENSVWFVQNGDPAKFIVLHKQPVPSRKNSSSPPETPKAPTANSATPA